MCFPIPLLVSIPMKRYSKIKTYCTVCRKLRIVTPLYKVSEEERNNIKNKYVCTDCTPDK